MLGIMPMVQSSPIWQLHQLLDWQAIDNQLVGLYKREQTHAGGPEPYHPLSMFKLMLLGQWHNLSDEKLEHALTVRIDFMAFTGFEPDDKGFPDASTICRFRNRLVQAQLDTQLLHHINKQLQHCGLKVQGCEGAIVDATIIASAARPKQEIQVNPQGAHIKHSADPDATWVKKGKKAYFGYRGYAVAETEDGYIEHIHMAPANESEVTKLTSVVDTLPQKPKAILADKGFASKANRHWLQEQGIEDCIQHKASRGKPLHPLYKAINKCIGKLRYKVEQGFGTMKRQFGLSRARYFTTAKVQAQMCWAALGMNLLKAHNKLKQMQLSQGVGAP